MTKSSPTTRKIDRRIHETRKGWMDHLAKAAQKDPAKHRKIQAKTGSK